MPDRLQSRCQKIVLLDKPNVSTHFHRSTVGPTKGRFWRVGGYIAFLIFSIGLWLTTDLAKSANQDVDNQTRSKDIDLFVTATRTDQPIRLDGVLNEPAWQNARPITDFIQIQPDEGAPPSLLTEVRLLYDQKNLYFGFTCYDNQIDELVANEMRRDGKNVHENDNVFILIDGHNDQRSVFFSDKSTWGTTGQSGFQERRQPELRLGRRLAS